MSKTRAIPAGAGETLRACLKSISLWGNPRGRGGDLSSADPSRYLKGQSPRARGRQFRSFPFFAGKRAIPAGAGET